MSNRSRIFTVLNWHTDRKEFVEKELLQKLPLRENDRIVVFYKASDYKAIPVYEVQDKEKIEVIAVTDSDGHNRAAGMNFMVSYIKNHYSGINPVVYTFYDSVVAQKDPTEFFEAIEIMCDKLKLNTWFSTYTDNCNFIFNKFDCRISVAINDPEYQALYDKTVLFTSHSNPSIMFINDLTKLSDEKMFDDNFEIPMFWIIKYLCEKAKAKDGFMNHYPTISEEIGVFKVASFKQQDFPIQRMQKEDLMFKELNLDHTPHQNVEELMDWIMERLK